VKNCGLPHQHAENALASKDWYIRTMLTLLFVYHDPEEDSGSLASARSTGDRLLVGCCSEAAKLLLSVGPVDAILVNQSHFQHDCHLLAKLNGLASRTAVMLISPWCKELNF